MIDYYAIIVNPNVAKWFTLEDSIGDLLSSSDTANHALAHSLVKGAIGGFKEFEAEVDEKDLPEWLKEANKKALEEKDNIPDTFLALDKLK
jgi:hypothetical protein